MPREHAKIDLEEARIIDGLSQHMDSVLTAFHAFGREGLRWKTQAESPGDADERRASKQYGPGGDWSPEQATRVSDAAILFLLAQSQHLEILQQSYASYRGLLFGTGPPARAILEIYGYVFWLLHPDVESIRTRVARGVLAELNSATRERTAAKSLGATQDTLEHLALSVRKVESLANSLFYPSEVTRDRAGRLLLCQQQHPGPGEALKHIDVAGEEPWNGRGAYAYLSNASHPTLHILTDSILHNEAGEATGFGYRDAVYLYRLARMAMVGFLRTWQLVAAYRGLNQGVPKGLAQQIDGLPAPE